jgi:serine/threonine protein kinase
LIEEKVMNTHGLVFICLVAAYLLVNVLAAIKVGAFTMGQRRTKPGRWCGVTLYQALTGRLPFAAADAMEWVHCQIARQPEPIDEEIPAHLSAIMTRLLAKTVEERYQTAVGLEADLRMCLAEWETQSHIAPFPLGKHDVPDRLLIPEKLHGREHEVNTLAAAFDRVVAHGTPELVLVSGYSGVGNPRL